MARLELEADESQGFGKDTIIEAQLAASKFREEGFAEGDVLLLTPRKARVFVDH